jgi:TPR repeat protein
VANNNLGGMYEDGLGTAKDYRRSAALYAEAARRGVIRAQYNLATMYYSGRGVPLDHVSAYLWYGRAAAGDASAAKVLRQLSGVMTPHQKELAQARLTESLAASIAEEPTHSPFDTARVSPK